MTAMIRFSDVKGVIFDLDDTLLYNGPADKPEEWLHSRSRLAAVHAVALKHQNQALLEFTAKENGKAFTTAAVHSIEGAIWNILFMKGLVASNQPDSSSSQAALVAEIAVEKNKLHESILRQFGVEVPGATTFIKTLAENGLSQHMALATSAIQRNIDIFLDKYQLHQYFPAARIISAEKVSKPKPDPECFERAFQSLALPDSSRQSVLAFEDNPRGIQSAKAAGLYICAITTKLKADDPELLITQPDLIADSYPEFSKLLKISIG